MIAMSEGDAPPGDVLPSSKVCPGRGASSTTDEGLAGGVNLSPPGDALATSHVCSALSSSARDGVIIFVSDPDEEGAGRMLTVSATNWLVSTNTPCVSVKVLSA